MITVFRIYFSQAWQEIGCTGALIGLLDGLPEFLYRAIQLTPDQLASASDEESRRAMARLVMTQAHVLVVPARQLAAGEGWTGYEVEAARHGFKHHTPILAVRCPDEATDQPLSDELASMVVSWDASEIACGILQVVEAASSSRRKARSPFANHRMPKAEMEGQQQRPLPVDEILSAYEAYKVSRQAPGTAN